MRLEGFARCKILVFAWALFSLSSMLRAEQVVESFGRLKMNWSTHRLELVGKAAFPQEANEALSLEKLESQALTEGLLYLQESIAEFLKERNFYHLDDMQRAELGGRASRGVYHRETIVVEKDRQVLVSLGSTLGYVFALPDSEAEKTSFRSPVPLSDECTGVQIILNKKIPPVPRYKLVSESGSQLFDIGKLTKEAYEKRLMGSWFAAPTPAELVAVIGTHPRAIQAQVLSGDRYQVDAKEWKALLNPCVGALVQGRIALGN